MKKLLFLVAGLVIAGAAWGADEWLKLRPVATDTRVSFPADQQKNNTAIDRVLANYREGMTLTYSSASTVVVTAGEIVCSNSDGSVRKMRKNPSNTNVTFANIDADSEEASKTYYVYSSCDDDAETAAFKISLSATTPTGLTSYKRLGSFYNDSSSAITQIVNDNLKQFRVVETKTVGTTYQATTDGFVSVFVTPSSADSLGYVRAYSDESSSPTTLLVSDTASTDFARVYDGGFTMPVKSGDYWKTTLTTTYGTAPTVTVYWTPYN